MIFQSRWYQNEAINSIFDYFAKGGRGNPLVALPTGTGKGVVIAKFVHLIFNMYRGQRIMMLTHVKELIEQNANKLREVWPEAPLGIYSAGLNSRDHALPITFGGVASVKKAMDKKPEQFGKIDLLLIDEAHLLSPSDDTMYQRVISNLTRINPHLKVIGFTATAWRTKQGMLTNEGLFTDICCDHTTYEKFNRLIAEGFICPLIPKHTTTQLDTSNVSISAGDFNQKQLAEAVDKDDVTYAAVKESIEFAADRRSWLFFASSIAHAEHIAAYLASFGIASAAVHSKLTAAQNDERITAFKSGEIRALVNRDKLTTGFDYAPIDFIGMMRPTLSPGLWVQMLGRGTRPSEATGKTNCLVLDFAGNTKRLGPINDPIIPRSKVKGTPGDPPIRICPACGVYNHASVRVCDNCGHEFSFASRIIETASTEALIKLDAPIVEIYPVQKVYYQIHYKTGMPPSLKVSYFSGLLEFNEWVTFEHPGMAGRKARDWWTRRCTLPVPPTTLEAMRQINDLPWPKRIRVHVNKRFPEILESEF